MNQAALELLIELKDQASAGLGALGDSLLSVGGLATGAGLLVGGALIGAGAAAWDMAGQTQAATNEIQSQLGATSAEADRLRDAALGVFGDNFAKDVGDATQSLIDVRQQMKSLSDDELQGATENAIRLRDVFGLDIPESTNAANTLMTQFNLTQQQAFDFIASGMQKGLNASGDFLDTIGEYSTQFANGGADAGQFFSLLESGLQGGMLGTDKAADAFKEFRLRIQDGSAATSAGLAQLGIDAAQLGQQMASGQVTAADAFSLVQERLAATEDPLIRMQAGAALIGSQFEDLGDSGVAAIDLQRTSLESLSGATETLNAKYNDWPNLFEGIKRSTLVALTPISDELLSIANEAMPIVQEGLAWFQEVLPPLIDQGVNAIRSFREQGEGIGQALEPAIQTVGEVWRTDLQPALTEGNDFLQNDLMPIMRDLGTAIMPVVSLAIQGVGIAWNEGLQPALSAGWSFFRDNIVPILKEGAHVLAEDVPRGIAVATDGWHTFQGALGGFRDTYIDPIIDGFEYIGGAVGRVAGVLDGFKNTLGGFQVPDWLQGHSPPPMADWFSYIADAASQANDAMPQEPGQWTGPALRGTSATGAGSGGITIQNLALSLPNIQTTNPQEFARQVIDVLSQYQRNNLNTGIVP